MAQQINHKMKEAGRKVYRFSFNERTHQDIIDIIESIPRPFRGEFIARAVRLMAGNMDSVFRANHTNKKGIDITKTFE